MLEREKENLQFLSSLEPPSLTAHVNKATRSFNVKISQAWTGNCFIYYIMISMIFWVKHMLELHIFSWVSEYVDLAVD